ncbi:unnamed protein product [Rotaria sordida]|uniref:Uncharacterized protein n=1 Tax=Rotaria sordida TaxID=392033 RepID=A0A819NEL8_9BILA|nr:unnamed protein product [Rotaria sordida]CAF3996838.1 unnamed protein product [Rotaria sordida]
MVGKEQTKLLKTVCKHAAIMRAPYCQSSWTSNSNKTTKKSSIENTTGKKFSSKVINLGTSKVHSDVAIKLNNIIKNLQDQLFFDKELTYGHLMFLLNNRNTIENKLLDMLFDRINDLNLDENIRG